ncbi:lysophospholipid acyltransferase family protein [Nesterenkonia populi]
MTSSFYINAKRFAVEPLVKAVWRPWVKGLDNIPEEGGAILAANHLSFFDSVLVPVVVPRPVSYLAKKDYWEMDGSVGKFNRWFFTATGQIPMDRSGGAASADSLRYGEEALKQGSLLGIYPEGTRSPDGKLYRGKLGVAKLALRAQVPVIPIALIGTDKVQPIEDSIPKVRRVGMIIGEPMSFESYYPMALDRFAQRSVTDQIMYQIMRLSGQEYVDVYGSEVKARLEAQEKK